MSLHFLLSFFLFSFVHSNFLFIQQIDFEIKFQNNLWIYIFGKKFILPNNANLLQVIITKKSKQIFFAQYTSEVLYDEFVGWLVRLFIGCSYSTQNGGLHMK